MTKVRKKKKKFNVDQFEKTPTGIRGLDEVTNGGLPKGRPTLICGGAGCGKTLFAMEFLVCGASRYDEPGVFVSFEENGEELATNVASLHFDLRKLEAQKKILIEHVYLERSEIQETGEYDLEGLFVRLNHAIDSIGAKRVVMDTLEALFAGLDNDAILRSELRRLFRWLKEKGVTAVITAERGEGGLTRHGLEEYVSDCVILLDHRVTEQLSTRRVRVVKYRGSSHGTNEYPFLIDEDGVSVLPITSLEFNYPGSRERISTGIKELDAMFGGKGYGKGSTILISGTAGTGKTSIAAAFAIAAMKRKERSLFISFEESIGQLSNNMESIGFDLQSGLKKGLLHMISTRPSYFVLERHLLAIHKVVEEFKPHVVVIDPLTSLIDQGNPVEVRSLFTRMIDLFKNRQITALFTGLTSTGNPNDMDSGQVEVSSLIDTWIMVRELEDASRKRTRGLFIVKSRGMPHSDQIQRLILSDGGITLVPEDADLGLSGPIDRKKESVRARRVRV